MSGRTTLRELWVGLVIVAALGGLIVLLGYASSGPGFLARTRTIDVVFRDGQGLRAGCPVRIAGIDAGRVVDIDLAEVDGSLGAKVQIALPSDLAKKLKQDVKITIQESLTGQSRVNIVSSGKSGVALVAGQTVRGVETNMFDPILEQIGMGPVERSHLSHTIAKVRETADAIGPRIEQIVESLQQVSTGVREVSETVRPTIVKTIDSIDELTKRVNAATPKVEAALAKVETLTTGASAIVNENRANIQSMITSVRELTATANDIALKDRVKVERLLDCVDGTRARTDRLLYQADVIAGQGVQIVTKNKADIERTLTNVRDATGWADKLVQKIFANPFVLSPLYKPTPEDVRVQGVYDSAQEFTQAAQELHDLVKTLDAMSARAQTPEQQQQVVQLRQAVNTVIQRLGQTSTALAEGLKQQQPGVRRARMR